MKPLIVGEDTDPRGALVVAEDGLAVPDAAPDRNPARVYLASYASEKSRTTMREALERVASVLPRPLPYDEVPWAELDYAHTNAIRAEVVRRYRVSTAKLTLTALRGVLRTAWRLGLTSTDRYMRATDLGRVRGRALPAGRALSPAEVSAVGTYCAAQPHAYGRMLSAVFALLVGCGLRADELGHLELGAYDPCGRAIRFVGKGQKEAQLPLGPHEAAALDAWLPARSMLGVQSGRLLVRVMRDGRVRRSPWTKKGLENLCRTVSREARVENFSPHDLRRTFCTTLLDRGLDLATVQRLMRHESPQTTARYDRRQAAADADARRAVTFYRWGEDVAQFSSPSLDWSTRYKVVCVHCGADWSNGACCEKRGT